MKFILLPVLITFLAVPSASSFQPDCTNKNIHCVGAGEEFDTDATYPEVAFQSAIDSAAPGDSIRIKGGTYQHTKGINFLTISNSGTPANPITLEPFENESVHIKGYGFTVIDNITGAETPNGSSREILIEILGDYIHIRRLELSNSIRHALNIAGSYNIIEEIQAHDNWLQNIIIGGYHDKAVKGNILRYIESYRSRHGSGIRIDRWSVFTKTVESNVIENSLSYLNGYQPNGTIVPPVTGDSQGGGNSDGIVSSKNCHTSAVQNGRLNMCPGNIIRGNIVWKNADDGFDMSFGDNSTVENNIAFENGPQGRQGYKGLSYAKGNINYLGNLSINSQEHGYELRAEGKITIHHNVAANIVKRGITLFNRGEASGSSANNNLVFDALGTTPIFVSSGTENSSNFVAESPVTNLLGNNNFSTKNLNFPPAGLTVKEKLRFLKIQFIEAFTPSMGSPLIDSGTFISGVHCDTADDDSQSPMPKDANCRHWTGLSPDIGAYEYGIEYVNNVFTNTIDRAPSAPTGLTVVITASTLNSAPIADAGSNLSVLAGARVDLDGSGSADANLDTLTYHWSFVSIPLGSKAVFDDKQSVRPSFTTATSGSYLIQLLVHDGKTYSEPSTVLITAVSTNTDSTVFVIGDSTVTNGGQTVYPKMGWGQVIGEYLIAAGATTTVLNKAISGRSSKDFYDKGNWAPIYESLSPGDYVFIQFGHNDETLNDPLRTTDPFTTYQEYLSIYIDGAREKGAYPVLITPMHRNRWNNNQIVDSHLDFPPAMRALAVGKNVPLIDLHVKSKTLFESLGQEYTTYNIFMHLTPGQFPNYPNGGTDNTHFQENGARELAKLIIEGIKESTYVEMQALIGTIP